MLSEADIIADARARSYAFEHGYVPPAQSDNALLLEAIEKCIAVEGRVEEILNTVPEPEDPDNETEVEALEYQRDFIYKRTMRAVRAGKDRRAHLLSLRTKDDWKQEKIRCTGITGGTDGLKHWFRYWAWAMDPRADYLANQPFVPFGVYEDDESDFQWRYIVWLQETTFIRRKSGIVEKARDMGATLGWLLWATCNWLFKADFTALLTSAKEELVDAKDNPDTLFEKVRYALRYQPVQLLPKEFRLDRGMPYMNIANPENKSVISGAAPTEDVGRQLRRTAVLKDESAAWKYGGFPQATALSHTSPSIFDVSSVRGKYNHFHMTATAPRANRFIMDWREHPWKDERWYNSLPHGYLSDVMTAETIAQEVDRDYDASQPGKVFKDWDEVYSCVEWQEVLAFYAELGYGDRFVEFDGTFKIPDDWNFARMQDKGETPGHPRMTLYCAVPGEAWPLKDSVFFFIEHMAPTAADLGTVTTQLTERQRQFNINPPRRPTHSLISHEAKNDRGVYQSLGWKWDAWDTDYDSGIGNIRLWIKPIDTHRPNPIRPVLNGRSRIYLVCANGQATLQYNEKQKKYYVGPAKDEYGFIRLRAEFPVYHYPPEEAGKPVKDQRPERIFDDALACVRGIAVLFGPRPKPQTQIEKLLQRLDPDVRPGAQAYQTGSPEHDAVLLSQKIWLEEFAAEDEEERQQGFGPLRTGGRITISRDTRE